MNCEKCAPTPASVSVSVSWAGFLGCLLGWASVVELAAFELNYISAAAWQFVIFRQMASHIAAGLLFWPRSKIT